jgi:RNA methyltransferase, TrmH family
MKNKSAKEIKYYGLHACQALWEKRPHDIIRVYLDPANVKIFSRLLKWCADQKKAYHIIPSNELNQVSDSVHHEGVCILARELPFLTDDALISHFNQDQSNVSLLYLDGVQNPHNLGSIMRTCAHFGVPFILGEAGQMPSLTPSACRIAKGAAEVVRLASLQNPLQLLNQLKKKGFSFIATSSHRGASLYRFSFPGRSIIALGSESFGISKSFQSMANCHIQIPGSGAMESLNVSVAAGLCLGEHYRQHGVS